MFSVYKEKEYYVYSKDKSNLIYLKYWIAYLKKKMLLYQKLTISMKFEKY